MFLLSIISILILIGRITNEHINMFSMYYTIFCVICVVYEVYTRFDGRTGVLTSYTIYLRQWFNSLGTVDIPSVNEDIVRDNESLRSDNAEMHNRIRCLERDIHQLTRSVNEGKPRIDPHDDSPNKTNSPEPENTREVEGKSQLDNNEVKSLF